MATTSPFHPEIRAKLADITRSKADVPVRTLSLESHGSGHRIVGEVLALKSGTYEEWRPTHWLANGRHRMRESLDLPFNLDEEVAAHAARQAAAQAYDAKTAGLADFLMNT